MATLKEVHDFLSMLDSLQSRYHESVVIQQRGDSPQFGPVHARHRRSPAGAGPGTGEVPGLDHPGNLGGSDSWEDAGPWRHRGSIQMSSASAR